MILKKQKSWYYICSNLILNINDNIKKELLNNKSDFSINELTQKLEEINLNTEAFKDFILWKAKKANFQIWNLNITFSKNENNSAYIINILKINL